MRSLDIGGHRLDLVRGTRSVPGGAASLTELETLFLAYLARRRDTVVSKGELLREVWGYAESSRSRAVDSTLVRVRGKLEGTGIVIESLRGRGLQLSAPATVAPAAALSSLIGRDDERQALQEMLAQPGLVVLWGPPGVGKSALADSLPGAAALRAHSAVAMEQELCRHLDCSVDALIGTLARVRPLLVVDANDDLEPGGHELVSAWARHTPVLLLGTRTREARADLRLEPLGPEEAAALMQRRTDLPLPTCRAIAARTDGLPRQLELMAEAVGFLGVEATEALSIGVFPAMEEAVEALWADLSEPQRAVLGNVSVFTRSFDLVAAAQVAEQNPHAVLPVLQQLWSRSLVQGGRGRFHLLGPVRAVAQRHLPAGASDRWVRWCAGLLDDNIRGGHRWQQHLDDLGDALALADGADAAAIGVLLVEATLLEPDLDRLKRSLVRDGQQRPLLVGLLSLAHALYDRIEVADALAALLDGPVADPSTELIRRAARSRRADADPMAPLLDQVPLAVAVAVVALAAATGWTPSRLVEDLATLCEEAELQAGARAMCSFAAARCRARDEPWLHWARRGGLEGRVTAELRVDDVAGARRVARQLLEVETDPFFRIVLAGMAACMAAVQGEAGEARRLLDRYPSSRPAHYHELARHLLGEPHSLPEPHATWVRHPPSRTARAPANDAGFFYAWALEHR